MTSRNLLGKLLLFAVGLLLITLGADVLAKGGPSKSRKPPPEPGQLQEPLSLSPKGIKWGMSHKEVIKVYDDLIDKEYLPKWETVQPGIGMRELEAEIQAKKDEFRQTRVDFGDLPTNLDGTAYVGEFTYRNGESMMSSERKGIKRTLFFIKGKLWKLVDVYPYGEKSYFGADLLAAVEKLEKKLGVSGRELAADPAVGRNRTELDWVDPQTHLRAVAWSDEAFALIYEDRETLAKIDSLRPNKAAGKADIDADTKAALRP